MINRHLLLSPFRMPLVELPRALEEYFAFAETEPTRRGRRFSITLPILNGNRLERLQWWYHVSPAHEKMFEGHGITVYRARAVERFCRHIKRWLEINRQHLHGHDPIPHLSAQQVPQPLPLAAEAPATKAQPQQSHSADILPWPLERTANG